MNQIDYQIEAVLFDFEGTLVDFQWNLERAVSEVIVTLEKEGCPSNLFGIDPSYTHIYNKSIELASGEDDIQSSTINNIISSTYDNYDLDALSRWQLYPETLDVLKRLKKENHKLGLVTNIGEYAIVKALKLFDLQEFFDVLITRNHVKFLKPNPEGLNLAMEKLDTTPRQVIFVGDSVNDIEAAHKAGVVSCFLHGGEYTETTNIKPVADFEIKQLHELIEILFIC